MGWLDVKLSFFSLFFCAVFAFAILLPCSLIAQGKGTVSGTIDNVVVELTSNPIINTLSPIIGGMNGGSSGSGVQVYTSCSLPQGKTNHRGYCQVGTGEECRGAKASAIDGLIECWQNNGHFTLVDSNGQRDDRFDSSGNSQRQFFSIQAVQGSGENGTAAKLYEIKDQKQSSPSLVGADGKQLVPSGTTDCQNYAAAGSSKISCLGPDGKRQDELSLDSLSENKKEIGIEDLADKVAIDLCAISIRKKDPSRPRKTKKLGEARDNSILAFGEQFNFSEKGKALKITIRKTENFGTRCEVDNQVCDRILVKDKQVECVSYLPSLTTKVLRSEEQKLSLRADFIKKEVLDTDREFVSLSEALKYSRSTDSFLKLMKAPSEIFNIQSVGSVRDSRMSQSQSR